MEENPKTQNEIQADESENEEDDRHQQNAIGWIPRTNHSTTEAPVIIPPSEPLFSSDATRNQIDLGSIQAKKKSREKLDAQPNWPEVVSPVEPGMYKSSNAPGKNQYGPETIPASEPPGELLTTFQAQEVSVKKQQNQASLQPIVIPPSEPPMAQPAITESRTPTDSINPRITSGQTGVTAVTGENPRMPGNQDNANDESAALAVIATPVEDPLVVQASAFQVGSEAEGASAADIAKNYKRGFFALLLAVVVLIVVIFGIGDRVPKQNVEGETENENGSIETGITVPPISGNVTMQPSSPTSKPGETETGTGTENGGVENDVLVPPISDSIAMQPSSSPTSKPSSSPTSKPSSRITFSPSQAPTSRVEQTVQNLKNVIVTQRGLSNAQDFDEETSPQSSALRWVAAAIPPSWDIFATDNFTRRVEQVKDVDMEIVLQAYALVVLYYSTGGPNAWRSQFNFLSINGERKNEEFPDVCMWKAGVSANFPEGIHDCDSYGIVTYLNLENNGLEGTIPGEIGALTSLTHIELSQNFITGTIPTKLGLLTNVEDLFLENNRISGTVPTEIALLTKLDTLYLENNDIGGNLTGLCLTHAVGNFEVDCSKVVCTCCDSCLSSRLKRVREIAVHLNMSSLEALADIESPQYLAGQWLADEDVAQIELPYPSNLDVQFEKQDDGLRYVQRYALAVLYMATCGETGKTGLGMGWLDGANFLSGDHECMWKNTEGSVGVAECISGNWVTSIQLDNNNLRHSIPKEIFYMQNIKELSLEENALSGFIPAEVGLLKSSLTHLALGRNRLGGNIPSEIGALTQLTSLRLHANRLTGTVPSELGDLHALEWFFSLAQNRLTGTLPSTLFSALGNKQDLLIYLQDNQFSGSLEFLCTEEVAKEENLHYFDTFVDRSEVMCTCCECCPCVNGSYCSYDVRI